MRSRRISATLGILILMAITARADKVTTDYDRSANFSRYKTFRWLDRPQTNEPFMQDRIMTTVNGQLTARGMRPVNDGADLAVGAHLATEEKHTLETYYSGGGWYWGGGWSTTEERTYQVGTLTVDLFDARTKKLVWQGVSVDTLSRHPEHRTRDYDKSIVKMFKDFPMFGFRESTVR